MQKIKPEFGKTFGLSFQSYKAVYVPNTNIVNLQLAKQLPGVGAYELQNETGKNTLSYTMGITNKIALINKNPPPNNYHPKYFS